MARQSLIVVHGAATFGSQDYPEFATARDVEKALHILKSNGVTHLDTAQMYGMGRSESILGETGAVGEGFTIDTKWVGGLATTMGLPDATTPGSILQTTTESLQRLRTDKVNIFWMHSPNTTTPFETTAKAINEAYEKGQFAKFGLSNYTPAQVKEVVDVCQKHGYVMPSVYQGNYSAAARLPEDELIPLLREHKIAFYAYSPIAGGFLTKDRAFIEAKQGRFGPDQHFGIYSKMFVQPSFFTFLDRWNEIAKEEGVSGVELAYRWINHHSALKPEYGDAIIFGATKMAQLKSTIDILKAGPLSDSASRKINELWPLVKEDSIIDGLAAIMS